jgi:cell shape-determining protein MreD
LSYLIGLAWGKERGLFLGILFGGLQDLFSIGVIGPNCLLKGLVGFGAGLLETFFIYFSLRAHSFVSFFASLLHDLIGALFFYGIFNGLTVLSWSTIGRAVYNCVITTGLLFVLSRKLHSGDPWIDKISR